jgi:hypothetical protein
MNHKLRYFITLLTTTVFGNQMVSAQPPQTPQNENNDSFLGKMGTSPDTAPGILNFSKADYFVDENSKKAVKITVNRTDCASGSPPVSVSYTVSNGTAQAGSDYQANSGRLVWGARPVGDCVPRDFSVAAINDNALEGNETINLNLSEAFGGVEIGTENAVLTIVDDDLVGHDGSIIDFDSIDYQVNENEAYATVTVERTHCNPNASLPASVSYHTTTIGGSGDNTGGGTADVGEDYVGMTGVLSWGTNPTNSCGPRSFNVPMIDDTIVDGDKTVPLSLTTARGAKLGKNSATLTIFDNDISSGPGQLRFSRTNYSTSENQQYATITVTRDECGPGSPAISISYASRHDTATLADYQSVRGTLSWEQESDCTAKSFQVPIKEDFTTEKRETVQLQLSNPTGGAEISVNKAVLTIYDNDFVRPTPVARDNPGVFSFSKANYTIEEQYRAAFITIERTECGSESPPASVTMTTRNGTAIASEDYQAVNVELHWGQIYLGKSFNGDCEPWYVEVETIDNTVFEKSETVQLLLRNPEVSPICESNRSSVAESRTGGLFSEPEPEPEPCTSDDPKLGQKEAVLTIIDNDGSTIGFSETEYRLDEYGKNAIITVTRSGEGCDGKPFPLPPASISYTTNNNKSTTAASGTDYVAMQGILSWGDTASGKSCGSRQFEVPIIDDPLVEGEEIIQLKLSRIRGATLEQNQASLIIVDDETKLSDED